MWSTLRIPSCGTLWDKNIPMDHFKDTCERQQTAHESGPQRSWKISNLFSGNPVEYPSPNFVSRTKRCLCQSMASNSESQKPQSFPDLRKPIISSLKWHDLGTLATESIKVSGDLQALKENRHLLECTICVNYCCNSELSSPEVHFTTSRQWRQWPTMSMW